MFDKKIPEFELFYINESKAIKGTNTINKCILFTDIKSSSLMWKDDDKKMYSALLKHEDQMFEFADKHNGLILKSIGDAYMVSFDELKEAIEFSIELQKESKESPISVGKNKIELRIGFCYGEVHEYKSERQGKKLLDYFGNVVNTASRLESKVSEPGEFAFAFQSKQSKSDKEEITKILDEKCKEFKVINYTEDCKDEKVNRSSRLLSDTHRYVCRSLKKLKGVDETIVYKCMI
jgi:hypothetical protein